MNKTFLLTGASAFALMLGVSAPAFAVDGAKADASGASSGNTAFDNGSQRDNLLENVFNPATGVVHNQQNNGNNNAINTATAVHADTTGGTSLETSARASSTSDDNESDHIGDNDPDRSNRVLNTMNGFVGAATLQQNNGDNNAIDASIALDGISGDTAGVDQKAMAEAKSKDQNGGEDLTDQGSTRNNRIEDAFNGAAGVFTVQQNNGNGNALSAATTVLGVTGDAGGLTQTATADAVSKGNASRGFRLKQDNLVTESFNEGFTGIATVQQNNGDSNGISAATVVAAVGGEVGDLTQHAIANGFGTGSHGNEIDIEEVFKRNTIGGNSSAFEGADGVVTVQQNNGDNNALSAANTVAANVGATGDIHQGTGVALGFTGAVSNNSESAFSSGFNTIDSNSFNGASGVFTVQQNNGDANTVGAATSVAGVTNGAGAIDQHARNGFFITGSARNNDDVNLISAFDSRKNMIEDAMNDMSGVATVQQNNGTANNMGAVTGVVAVGGVSGDVLQSVTAGTGKSGSAFNQVHHENNVFRNLIDPAFERYEGIATVQQNNGDANNIVALTAVTATNGSGTVGQDISADNVSLGNRTRAGSSVADPVRSNEVLNSFNDLKGIATVQQNNGDANSIVAASGVVVVMGESGDTTQTISASGESEDGLHSAGALLRVNLIDPSFTNLEGVLTVQQNNGSGNALTALTGVIANQDGDDLDTAQNISAGGAVDGTGSSGTGIQVFPHRRNIITDGSFQNLKGVATVQQNNGGGNVISASTGVTANLGAGPLDDIVAQNVNTDGSVNGSNGNDSSAFGAGGRLNTLDAGVFNGSNGIVTVQQNNGGNNVMSVATGVRAETGGGAQTTPDEESVSEQTAMTAGSVSDSQSDETNLHLIDPHLSRHNQLTNGFKGGVNGIYTVQQNNGDNNVIGSATAVAANVNGIEDIDEVLDNLARAEGTVSDNAGGEFTDGARSQFLNRRNTFNAGAFDGAAGIVTVQQNNGNNNVVGAATGVVANIDNEYRFGKAVTAGAEAEATVSGNTVLSNAVDRGNTIDSSLNNVQGIATVQQNNGDNNVIGAATEVVASTELPGFGPAESLAELDATVSGNTSTVDGTLTQSWSNSVTVAFNGTAGVVSSQQNNGNNNAMGSTISLVTNGIDFGFNN